MLKTKKPSKVLKSLVAMLLAVLTLFSSIIPTLAVTIDVSGSGSSGQLEASGANSGWVKPVGRYEREWYGPDGKVIGYRFSVVDRYSGNKIGRSIDAICNEISPNTYGNYANYEANSCSRANYLRSSGRYSKTEIYNMYKNGSPLFSAIPENVSGDDYYYWCDGGWGDGFTKLPKSIFDSTGTTSYIRAWEENPNYIHSMLPYMGFPDGIYELDNDMLVLVEPLYPSKIYENASEFGVAKYRFFIFTPAEYAFMYYKEKGTIYVDANDKDWYAMFPVTHGLWQNQMMINGPKGDANPLADLGLGAGGELQLFEKGQNPVHPEWNNSDFIINNAYGTHVLIPNTSMEVNAQIIQRVHTGSGVTETVLENKTITVPSSKDTVNFTHTWADTVSNGGLTYTGDMNNVTVDYWTGQSHKVETLAGKNSWALSSLYFLI